MIFFSQRIQNPNLKKFFFFFFFGGGGGGVSGAGSGVGGRWMDS